MTQRPLVLIDLGPADIESIRYRLLVVSVSANLSWPDVAALCDVSVQSLHHFTGSERRVSCETLRRIIAAFPELANGLPVEIRPR